MDFYLTSSASSFLCFQIKMNICPVEKSAIFDRDAISGCVKTK